MDSKIFDSLAQSLHNAHSRRGALASLLGGALGLGSLSDMAARKGKGKKRKRRKGKRSTAPTCSDGIKNGSETDVDCGGACPRCVNGKTCVSRNDCVGALCINGTCTACTSSPSNCGAETNGQSCICRAPIAGGPKVCTKNNTAGPTVTDCESCLPGTFCVGPVAGGYNCTRFCGAA